MKKFLISILFFVTLPAISGEVNDIQIVKGKCTAQSHIAEGPINADLTKRQSRFFCDSVAITFFDESSSHIMLTFLDSKSHTSKHIGYGGIMDSDGQFLNVKNVYLGENSYPVEEGICKVSFKKKQLDSIVCGAPIDQGQRRTVPVVVFEATKKK